MKSSVLSVQIVTATVGGSRSPGVAGAGVWLPPHAARRPTITNGTTKRVSFIFMV